MRRILFLSILPFTLLNCSQQPNHVASGYIEGRYTYMATNVSGVLDALWVQRGTWVRKGQKLFILQSQPESDRYWAATENLKQATFARDAIEANRAYSKLTYQRYKALVPKGAIQQSQLDNAQSIYDSKIAQLAQANSNIISTKAALAEAKWILEQKAIKAPTDAFVFDTYYRVGEYTEERRPILSLLAAKDIKAIFYIPEPDLAIINLGDAIQVQCDGCKEGYAGRISFISPTAEYTLPVIFSNETNPKLVYRIEAEFKPEIAYRLHPGQPVMVKYHNIGTS